MKKTTNVGVFALAMLIAGAVDGVSNLPTIALFGQSLVFFIILGSVLFLLPTGLISAELCAQYPHDSGVYAWTKKAFGSAFGALTIWLQWINTMVWFPTCLTTLVGTIAFLIHPALIHHPVYLVGASLAVFWIMTLANFKGIQHSSRIASLTALVGLLIPMTTIIVLSLVWVLMGKPLAIHLTKQAIAPAISHTQTWTSLTAIIASFVGMELATVHAKKIQSAHTVFPRALSIAIIIIVLSMGLGSLGVALVVPHDKIVLVSGTIQAFHTLFSGLHMGWLSNVLGVMLLFGSLGAMVNWLISPANGLAQAAKDHYLPTIFSQENAHGVPYVVLIAQGIVVSLISSVFFLMPSINGSYWLLLDLGTQLYLLMYLFMFISAIKLLLQTTTIKLIPGKKMGAILVAALGLIGCVIALVIGFFPPKGINTGVAGHFIVTFSCGLLIMCLPASFLHLYKKAHAC